MEVQLEDLAMSRHKVSYESWIGGWSTHAPTTYQGSETLAFQRWFKFKEAFSPKLVWEVIQTLPVKPRHIVDCFGGSGTTGMVAKLLGTRATVIEVNPFLADLISAKLGDYKLIDLENQLDVVLSAADGMPVKLKNIRKRLPQTFVEPGTSGQWVFSKAIVTEIETLRLAIELLEDESVRKFFRVALGSVLIEASNVRIDGKGRRYRKNWQDRLVTKNALRQAFVFTVQDMAVDIANFPHVAGENCQVLNGDSRKMIADIPTSIDLAIFSPPYPNSFDYTDIYNIELWMLGYLGNYSDNAILRQSTLRSHVQIAWEGPKNHIRSKTLNSIVSQLQDLIAVLWDKRIPQMIQAYFEDLDNIIGQLA